MTAPDPFDPASLRIDPNTPPPTQPIGDPECSNCGLDEAACTRRLCEPCQRELLEDGDYA